MLEVMTAKAYAKRTGYPLETIRRMCRDGELPCDKRGKVYLIDFSASDLIIKERMLSAQAEKMKQGSLSKGAVKYTFAQVIARDLIIYLR